MHLRSRHLLVAACAAFATAISAPASASKWMEIGISDEGVTQRAPGYSASVIPEWKQVGVDVARVMVIWSYVAPGADSKTQPAGFDPTNPGDPQYRWGPIDETMDQLRAAGIEPVVAVTGPGPLWGSRAPSAGNQRYKPDPRKFADFATAVARRYGAGVSRWLIWNEPNVNSWLQPQQDCVKRRCTPAAPAIYRSLVRAAYPAIKAADPGSTVIAGTLAPRGQTPRGRNSNVRSLAFLRNFGCVDRKLRPERKSRYCKKGFKPATADGFAYHPHGTVFSPTKSFPNRDEASLADFRSRLLRTLDGIQRRGRFLNAGSRTKKFGVYFTEYGYQTNPPDPFGGVTRSQQRDWVQQGTYLAWRQPRVKMLIQYLWRDDPLGKSYSGWQSGLYSFDGRRKPLRAAFPNPLWIDLPKRRRTATVWGQVRPGDRAEVTVQKRTRTRWNTLRKVKTNSRGYFAFKTVVRTKTSFRYRYKLADAAGKQRTHSSLTMTVTPTKAKSRRRR